MLRSCRHAPQHISTLNRFTPAPPCSRRAGGMLFSTLHFSKPPYPQNWVTPIEKQIPRFSLLYSSRRTKPVHANSCVQVFINYIIPRLRLSLKTLPTIRNSLPSLPPGGASPAPVPHHPTPHSLPHNSTRCAPPPIHRLSPPSPPHCHQPDG